MVIPDQGRAPPAASSAEVEVAAAPRPIPVVIRYDNVGMRVTIPEGWAAASNDQMMRNLKRIDDRQRELGNIITSIESGRIVPLIVSKQPGHGPDERITAGVNVLDGPADADPLTLLEGRKPGFQRTFENFVVIKDVHEIYRDGVRGAELTEEHSLPLKDGTAERMRVTFRFFVRGPHIIIFSVSCVTKGEESPPDVRQMLEIVSFEAITD